MVTKNRLTASRGGTPQAHLRSERRLLASKVAADMSTDDVFRPPRQFRRGNGKKKNVRDGLAQPGNQPDQHFLC